MSKTERELKPWDRRPWPKSGTPNIDVVYAEVGHALSTWERYEFTLAILYAAFVADEDYLGARRSYAAIRTFEGRADMLRAASTAFFERKPHPQAQESFKAVLTAATSFSPRRNDIAHGHVFIYYPTPDLTDVVLKPESYALYPSQASFRERDTRNQPTYCMAHPELNYFSEQFLKLQRPAAVLTQAIRKFRKLPPLPPTFYE